LLHKCRIRQFNNQGNGAESPQQMVDSILFTTSEVGNGTRRQTELISNLLQQFLPGPVEAAESLQLSGTRASVTVETQSAKSQNLVTHRKGPDLR
jgi:hypothetical protein